MNYLRSALYTQNPVLLSNQESLDTVLQEASAGKEKLFVHLKLMPLLINDKNQFEKYHYSH